MFWETGGWHYSLVLKKETQAFREWKQAPSLTHDESVLWCRLSLILFFFRGLGGGLVEVRCLRQECWKPVWYSACVSFWVFRVLDYGTVFVMRSRCVGVRISACVRLLLFLWCWNSTFVKGNPSIWTQIRHPQSMLGGCFSWEMHTLGTIFEESWALHWLKSAWLGKYCTGLENHATSFSRSVILVVYSAMISAWWTIMCLYITFFLSDTYIWKGIFHINTDVWLIDCKLLVEGCYICR